ncbi:D-arabinono-1,4-lactone oxidase [Tenacibaculum maritimum]|uniref:D-arabinono-1,4-lactone oxidase n=1 Tax=Tenacibaculum maritimum TaxID=107401 RepID=UPI0038905528
MKNWSENQQWNPKQFLQPSTEKEIIEIVSEAIKNQRKIRIYGSKHSFSSLNNTDDICLNLDNYQGIVKINEANNYVTVRGGTKLYKLTSLLASYGFAMENMGDVDKQSIAGAIGTGTHGTGIKLGSISTQVVAIKFINGLGETVYCSEHENRELFKCLQISLGVFGIITEVTLKCVANYKLKLEKKSELLTDVLTNLEALNKNNRNFEFYWLPYTNSVQTKYSNITDKEEDKDSFLNYFNDIIIENYVFKLLCNSAKWFPKLNTTVAKISSNFLSNTTKIKDSKNVYATPRLVKFTEMEYNVPIEAYKEAMKDIVNCIYRKKFNIHFPIENRFVQKDDIYISPAYQRESAYIACHVYKGKEYKKYFEALEEIFSKYEGRPHWGKIHYKKAEYFYEKYPMFGVYNEQRKRQDPEEIFLNENLRNILMV